MGSLLLLVRIGGGVCTMKTSTVFCVCLISHTILPTVTTQSKGTRRRVARRNWRPLSTWCLQPKQVSLTLGSVEVPVQIKHACTCDRVTFTVCLHLNVFAVEAQQLFNETVCTRPHLGILTLTLTNPIWVTKTRLVLQYNSDSSSKRYKGMVDALVKIYRHEGVPGLYKVRSTVVLVSYLSLSNPLLITCIGCVHPNPSCKCR